MRIQGMFCINLLAIGAFLKEWRDSDGDGIGDHADTDIDGDGWSNTEEEKVETDPLDKLSFPLE